MLSEGPRARGRERNHRALVAGVEAMGMQMAVAQPHRLWTLNTVGIPPAWTTRSVSRLLNEFNIETAAGPSSVPHKGKVWRVGLG